MSKELIDTWDLYREKDYSVSYFHDGLETCDVDFFDIGVSMDDDDFDDVIIVVKVCHMGVVISTKEITVNHYLELEHGNNNGQNSQIRYEVDLLKSYFRGDTIDNILK